MSNSVKRIVRTVNNVQQENNDAYEQPFRFAEDNNVLLEYSKTTDNSCNNKANINRYIFRSEYYNYPKSTIRICCEILIALCFIATGIYASLI